MNKVLKTNLFLIGGCLMVLAIFGIIFSIDTSRNSVDDKKEASEGVAQEESSNKEEVPTEKPSNVTSNQTSNTKPTSNVSSNTTSNKVVSSNVSSSSNVSKPITSNTQSGSVQIIDKCGPNTAQAIDEFYQDSSYVYYFNTMRSSCIYVKLNGTEYTVKYALNNKLVSMQTLEKAGFKCLKKSRNLATK